MKIFQIPISRSIKTIRKKSNVLLYAKKTIQTPPSRRYLNLIIQGYKDCGYKNNYIVISRNKKIKVR